MNKKIKWPCPMDNFNISHGNYSMVSNVLIKRYKELGLTEKTLQTALYILSCSIGYPIEDKHLMPGIGYSGRCKIRGKLKKVGISAARSVKAKNGRFYYQGHCYNCDELIKNINTLCVSWDELVGRLSVREEAKRILKG